MASRCGLDLLHALIPHTRLTTCYFYGCRHVIDTHNVSAAHLRGCTECECKTTNASFSLVQRSPWLDGSRYTGGLECCKSSDEKEGGARCPVADAAKELTHTYYYE